MVTTVALAQGPGGGGATPPSDCSASAYTQDGGTKVLWNKTYTAVDSASGTNCAVYATGGAKLKLNNSKLTSLQTAGGGGSGLEANDSSVVTLNNAIINVDGVNGVYASSYDTACYSTSGTETVSALPCTWVTLNNVTINAVNSSAHGIDAMFMGRIDLNNVRINTTGAQAAGAVVNDTGDGIVNARNVFAHTEGAGSSGIYEIGSNSTFNIRDSVFIADTSDGAAVVVGGTANLSNTFVFGGKEGLLVDGTVTIDGGAVVGTVAGTASDSPYNGNPNTSTPFTFPSGNAINIMPFGAPAIFPATVTVKNGAVLQPVPGAYLIYETSETGVDASGNPIVCTAAEQAATPPACSVVNATFNAQDEFLRGDIHVVADGSTLAVNLAHSKLRGAVANAGLTLDERSQWTVTGDSILTTLAVPGDSPLRYINSTGKYTVTYDSTIAANQWLAKGTYYLRGGATLKPE